MWKTRLAGKCFSCCLPRATECHGKRAFRISRHFLRKRKAAGLTGDQAENKRARSGRLELLVTVLLVLAARARLSTIVTKDTHFAFLAIFVHCHAFCRVTSPASLLLFPVCCNLLSPPAASISASCLAKTRREVARVWRSSWGGF